MSAFNSLSEGGGKGGEKPGSFTPQITFLQVGPQVFRAVACIRQDGCRGSWLCGDLGACVIQHYDLKELVGNSNQETMS